MTFLVIPGLLLGLGGFGEERLGRSRGLGGRLFDLYGGRFRPLGNGRFLPRRGLYPRQSCPELLFGDFWKRREGRAHRPIDRKSLHGGQEILPALNLAALRDGLFPHLGSDRAWNFGRSNLDRLGLGDIVRNGGSHLGR